MRRRTDGRRAETVVMPWVTRLSAADDDRDGGDPLSRGTPIDKQRSQVEAPIITSSSSSRSS